MREGQRHLRELSVQRQMLLLNGERSKSGTPLGVQAFLQPRGGSQTPSLSARRRELAGSQAQLPPPASPRSLPRHQASLERLPRSSVGKQTVAEAALATGSSLQLYRHPDAAEERPLT